MDESESDDGLEACASDLIDAIHARDIKAAAAALRAVFELVDSQPHEEGPHLPEEQENS